ncbi:unnamed protein product [Symbiodinium sp. CCMP2592]|nr:unnamed protein product [Symbiodinium sp. CCMP2592]
MAASDVGPAVASARFGAVPPCLIPRIRGGRAAALAARPLPPITAEMRRAIATLKDAGASRDVFYDVVDPELASREEQVDYFNAAGANNNGWQLESPGPKSGLGCCLPCR